MVGRRIPKSWVVLTVSIVATNLLLDSVLLPAESFLLPRPLSQPRKQTRCRLEESSRLQLQRKSGARKDDPPQESATKSWFTDNNISRAVLATAAAAWLLLVPVNNAAIAVSSSSSDNPEYLSISERDIQIQANKKLIDYAVGTVNTQYYDSSGGARFNPSDFYRQWKDVQKKLEGAEEEDVQELSLDNRDGTVQTLKYLVSTLKDPYSKYMTREDLQFEFKGSHDGFLGTGAYIEVPKTTPTSPSSSSSQYTTTTSSLPKAIHNRGVEQTNFQANIAKERLQKKKSSEKTKQVLLTNTKVANLPVVTAVAPNSPAERAGLVVGDKIVGVGDKDNFLGYGKDEITKCLVTKWGYSDPNGSSHRKTSSSNRQQKTNELPSRYFGVADLTIAKPVYSYSTAEVPTKTESGSNDLQTAVSSEVLPSSNREIVLGYRSTKVKLPTIATASSSKALANRSSNNGNRNLRGDAVVQYDLLSSSSSSAGGSLASLDNDTNDAAITNKVGYIRLTRFSKSSTEGYLNAINTLEDEGADSYVIDLRNNYGGVIQEAMLTASTLLGDPHAILCYLLNARGGFTPVDVESYVVDARYPGYLLSKEEKTSVLEQVIKENPNMFRTVSVGDQSSNPRSSSSSIMDDLWLKSGSGSNKRLVADWDPPSSYASIHEQVAKRGIHRITYANYENSADLGSSYGAILASSSNHKHSNNRFSSSSSSDNALLYRQRMFQQKLLQKDVVLLINEGTASSSEFFVAALQDNGRSLAVVGTKSFGKGIIQHTFPMPDGGGLKLTIGEFLRPSLQHVTNVFGVGFVDKTSGEIVDKGGITPDVYCESRQGIPGTPKADLCVKVALDVLEEHRSAATPALPQSTNVISRGSP